MDFDRMPKDWPNRTSARMTRARPHDWCVFEVGRGPEILLLHGAGGSAHSFRNLIPELADYRCLVPDLPGQGFTRAGNKGRLGIDPMAEDIARLIEHEGWAPKLVIGHSAGAALALRLSTLIPLDRIVGINAALGSFEGAAGVLFPLLARVLSVTPFVPRFVSGLWGNAPTVRRLLTSTGSPPDEAGLRQYIALVQDAAHVDGTLGMMAQWKLDALMADAPKLATPTLLIATTGDKVVPARVSRDAAALMPDATYRELPKLGHLAHEEAGARIGTVIRDWLVDPG
ncbi:MAG: alpha/beta fold hydrolase BchO [Tabrizicola sp.]|uniref:alpha/beta fold hydrolase BchO n=1 Tax=Tabrizicola sp. TaxID=2005166 RepID=UPI0027330CDA|nr:alpha/beta fold hydrolase BchO [Tabrizicola sp.]MDP3265134.1 alpha/beta fold hydrolase [Tabrizicola sp.]MDP3646902.1 alpha/beta fold hydrolase [Paracoccaceae bacterium]MDZ4068245.1 alpha/beta fold hydrolase BchO [Tabrizicola sp.]